MDVISLLKEAIKQEIITLSDFYFSISITQYQSPKMIFLAICINYFIRTGGHTCLPISIIEKKEIFLEKKNKILINKIWKTTQLLNNLRIELLTNKMISNGSHPTPFVLFNEKIYLNKTWKAEKTIFKFLSKPECSKTKNLITIKNKIAHLLCKKIDNLQKIAIILSIINKITFIIGEPGTGKTTIVSKILTAIISISNKKLKIQLAASTGKAANRLTESIEKFISKFKSLYEKKNILIQPAVTLHRFLGIQSENNLNFKKLNYYSEIDVLIIDETSMIDIFTMERLIKNISKETKVIFLGDHHQLPSVNCGHILKDIYSYYYNGYSKSIIKKINFFGIFNIKEIKDYKFSNINDKICILKTNYRFTLKSNIFKISTKIKKNKFKNFEKLFLNTYEDIKFISLDTDQDYKKMISNLIKNYMYYWNHLKTTKNFLDIMLIFNYYRLICVLQDGPFGVKGLNTALENEMKNKGLIKTIVINKKIVYFGQPIIILKNNYTIKLYNGDIGIILYDKKNELKAFFFNKNKFDVKCIPINILPRFQTNWAMTAHKSQGSEFQHVVLVLPNYNSNVLTKELIYTAITRTKTKLTIYSNKEIFMKSIKNRTNRYSSLSKNECIY
ncbi:MAG: exodeoxyribonuclease V subunit alpha [Buchnera aphidicola (Floraphis choui)]